MCPFGRSASVHGEDPPSPQVGKGDRTGQVQPVFSEGLPMIGKLLGHSRVQTTARYAHLADDPVKEAADRIASRIARVAG